MRRNYKWRRRILEYFYTVWGRLKRRQVRGRDDPEKPQEAGEWISGNEGESFGIRPSVYFLEDSWENFFTYDKTSRISCADKFPFHEGIAVPERPFWIVVRSSWSDFSPRTVKLAAGGINIFPIGPSPFPIRPWQLRQWVVYTDFPLSRLPCSLSDGDGAFCKWGGLETRGDISFWWVKYSDNRIMDSSGIGQPNASFIFLMISVHFFCECGGCI